MKTRKLVLMLSAAAVTGAAFAAITGSSGHQAGYADATRSVPPVSRKTPRVVVTATREDRAKALAAAR